MRPNLLLWYNNKANPAFVKTSDESIIYVHITCRCPKQNLPILIIIFKVRDALKSNITNY